MVRVRTSFFCLLISLLSIPTALAQADKMEVDNVTYLSTGCTIDMTPDQCMFAGSSTAGLGCQRCVSGPFDQNGNYVGAYTWCGAADVYLAKFPLISNCQAVNSCYTMPDVGQVCYATCTGNACYLV